MRLSVILPNYNGRRLLQAYFLENHRILQQETGGDFEIIVTDDHSTDGSGQFVEKMSLPNVRFLLNPGKRGFGNNCNHGARHASGEILFFLNTDVVLTAGFLNPLLNKLADEQVFSVVPRIVRANQNNMVESITTGALSPCEIKLEYKNKLNKNPGLNHKVLWACGAALCCRRDIFRQLGGFANEYNPYYVEDVDLSVTAWRCGFENWYVGSAIVLHYHNSTTQKEWQQKKKIIHMRNIEIFNLKHLPKSEGRRCLTRKIIACLRRFDFRRMLALLLAWRALPKKAREFPYSIEDVFRFVEEPGNVR